MLEFHLGQDQPGEWPLEYIYVPRQTSMLDLVARLFEAALR